MVKRGRKRKSEMYFGPNEEAAVIKFLEYTYKTTLDLKKGKPIKIEHNLGENISVDVYYTIDNENDYLGEPKTIDVHIDVITSNITETSLMIESNEDVKNANIVIVDIVNKNLIFNQWLKAPLDKMIESIIRKYKLYRKGETFEELHRDTASFLMTKVHKFESARGKKAYSYFGTISKNYILGLLIKDEKYMKQTSSYEDVSDNIEERGDLSYVIDADIFSMDDFIKKVVEGVKTELDDENQPAKKKLTENERKVGYALTDILENWEEIFENMEGGSKYNKNSVLETMRNYTNLSTKDIRLAMKRFKELYVFQKQLGLD